MVPFSITFKVYYLMSNNSKMVQDRVIYLQRQTNSKSYMIYRTAPFSTTLKDP